MEKSKDDYSNSATFYKSHIKQYFIMDVKLKLCHPSLGRGENNE